MKLFMLLFYEFSNFKELLLFVSITMSLVSALTHSTKTPMCWALRYLNNVYGCVQVQPLICVHTNLQTGYEQGEKTAEQAARHARARTILSTDWRRQILLIRKCSMKILPISKMHLKQIVYISKFSNLL